MDYIKNHLEESKQIIGRINPRDIFDIVKCLKKVKLQNGRVFFIGVGGGAGNSSHAVNDFRKIADIEAYTPTDNVSELTARVNDDGWDTVFVEFLKTSHLTDKDMVFVFSVGGGNKEKNVSVNIINALEYAKKVGAVVCGIVGRDGGFTAKVADACVVIPIVNDESVTPHTEAFQGVIWHLIISHPDILTYKMKWESIK